MILADVANQMEKGDSNNTISFQSVEFEKFDSKTWEDGNKKTASNNKLQLLLFSFHYGKSFTLFNINKWAQASQTAN